MRPAEVVAVERLEEALDVFAREAARVIAVVDVARRGPDQHELCEPIRFLHGGEDPDHRAHGVPDEDQIVQLELAADLEHVVGVTLERPVLEAVVRREVRAAGADVVEEDDAVFVLERRGDVPPHVLIAAEPVHEHHRLGPDRAGQNDVVPADHVHAVGS